MATKAPVSGIATRIVVPVGRNAAGDNLFLELTDDGFLPVKFMALDVDGTGEDIQVVCTPQGELKSSAALKAYVDNVEQYILDTLDHYKISDIDDGNATYDYFGFLAKGGEWYIMRFDNSAGWEVNAKYKKGASGYDFSARASGSYNDFATEF